VEINVRSTGALPVERSTRVDGRTAMDQRPQPTGEHLLVVEDEPTLRELLATSLQFVGFTVSSVATGAEAFAAAAERRPDLVVLDVMLPDIDGFEVLRRLRSRYDAATAHRSGYLPVLFLTARDDPEDKVAGLTSGADDYMTKPFKLDELIARIRAILRRTGLRPTAVFTVADLEFDPDAHLVKRAGRPVQLSPTEYRLLRYLLENVDRPLSKAQILEDVWQYDFSGDHSIVESYISYLRRKIDNVEPRLIHTVRGIGYALRRPQP
jgi:two-component system OmpR family response regulator